MSRRLVQQQRSKNGHPRDSRLPRNLVWLPSPTMPACQATAAIPARGSIGLRRARRSSSDRRDRHALQCRLFGTLLADLYLASRGIGFSRLEHALSRRGRSIHPRTCARRYLGRDEMAARNVRGAETIVVLGNSGGGSLMAAYPGRSDQIRRFTCGGGKRPGNRGARLNCAAARPILYFAQCASGSPRSVDELDGCLGRR